jgi:hypothetical protein
MDNPMKEFIGSMIDTLEKKEQARPFTIQSRWCNLNMFSLSSSKNIEDERGSTREQGKLHQEIPCGKNPVTERYELDL